MKKNLLKILIGIIAIVLVIRFSQSRFPGNYIRLAGFTQGTTYHITYKSKDKKNLQNEIDTLLADFDRSLSTYLPGSLISRINHNDTTVIADDHFTKVFHKALEVHRESDGAFDITVAPVVNAWGFGFTEKADVDSNMIDSLLQYVGMNKTRLKNGKIVKEHQETMFDVNAIAQGYSVDVVADYFDKKGIKNYLVEIGGEVRTKGRNPEYRIWTIGIDMPVDNNFIPGEMVQTRLLLRNGSLATSGNYRSFYEQDGIKYVHSIDPKTGYPVTSNLLSVTVQAGDCMSADAYATAFMVMGLDKSIAFLAKHKELQAYLIYSDADGNFKTYVTKKMQRNIRE
ncbi:MAG TPA: FAD:protein FMN transferase [Bacteroidales bacterium]|nr:FAD:protein FMN transferase [Bacteroidales bacterium]